MNRRTARDNTRTLSDVSAHGVLVVAAVAGKRNRDHKVVHVIPDEVKDYNEFFFIDLTKATAELLDEDNRGFGRAKHNYLVDLGKVNALVKDINGKYVIELIFGSIVYKSCAHFFASTLIVFSG